MITPLQLTRGRSAAWLAFCCAALVGLLASPAQAQLPATRLASLFPSGAQVGSSVEVVVAGDDLDGVEEEGVDELHFSHPGIKAQRKMEEPGPFDEGPQRQVNTFEVTVASNVPPGLYDARVIGRYGISNPRAFTVTELPQSQEVEPNNDPAEATPLEWPVELSALSQRAGDVDYYQFKAEAGQRLILSCLSRRIDSRMNPVLVLLDSQGRELQSSRDGPQGDAVLEFTPQTSGDFVLKVHDTRFNGGDDYFYRLRVGPLPQIDFVFPPAGEQGGTRPFTLYGRNLPGGKPTDVTLGGQRLERLDVTIPLPQGPALDELKYNARIDSESAGMDGQEYRLKSPQGLSNPVLIGVASSPVVQEQEPNNTAAQAQMLTLPCEVAGQFYPERDYDWYQFEAQAGEEIVVELFSQRLGRPTDPALHIERTLPPPETDEAETKDNSVAESPSEQIEIVATSDDAAQVGAGEFSTRTLDPAVRFTAPADGIYRVLLRDGVSQVTGDPRNVYRLVIRRPNPGFRLAAAPGSPSGGSLQIRKGGSERIRVVAYRQDRFDGEIKVSVTGLPAGVTSEEVVIGPTTDVATLVLTASETASSDFALVKVTGEATVEGKVVKQTARCGSPLWPLPTRPGNQPQPPGPARLAENLAVSVSADELAPVLLQVGEGKVWEASRGGILKIPYTVTRRDGFSGNLVCRVEELPENVNVQQITINGNQTSGEFPITLRSNTPTGTYTVHLAALAQPLSYTRNPESAERAEARKAELAQIVTDLTKKSQEATSAKTAADRLATEAKGELTKATTAKQAAEKAAEDAAKAAQAAAEAAAKAREAAAAKPEDTNLAAAAEATKKGAEEAESKSKLATAAIAEAEKNLTEAMAQQEAAAKDQADKDQAATDAAELLKLGQQAKAEADRKATAATNAARQRNLNNVYFPSTSFTLKITPAPITMDLGSDTVTLKQGEKAELPVRIERLYDYADRVTISGIIPSGVGGLSIPNVNIEKDQKQAPLAINANANATAGSHELTVRISLNINGQNLTVEQPLTLKIELAEPTN